MPSEKRRPFFLPFGFMLASAIYAVWMQKPSSPVIFQRTESSSPPPSPAETLVKAGPPIKKSGQYNDGVYTGDPADAYYGTVQVSATIQNGRLAFVRFLQYPNDRQTSRFINSQAMPALVQEAIRAQNANVDTVSGATDTSQAFRDSLSSALATAKH